MIPQDVKDRILIRFPHLARLALVSDRVFAQNACRLSMAPGVSLAEYYWLARVAVGGPYIEPALRACDMALPLPRHSR